VAIATAIKKILNLCFLLFLNNSIYQYNKEDIMAFITKEKYIEFKKQSEINDQLDKERYLADQKLISKLKTNKATCTIKNCNCICHKLNKTHK
jgi:hypothetical protein